jgi:hypothetical protein
MRVRMGIAIAGLVLAAAACSDSGAPSIDSFVGTWNATRMEFTRVANPADKEEIIAGGATFQITLKADSTWSGVLTVPPGAADTASGTWSASLDVLTIVTTGMSGEQQFDYVLSGTTLTLSGANTDWDFGSGDEAATLSITLTKQ